MCACVCVCVCVCKTGDDDITSAQVGGFSVHIRKSVGGFSVHIRKSVQGFCEKLAKFGPKHLFCQWETRNRF